MVRGQMWDSGSARAAQAWTPRAAGTQNSVISSIFWRPRSLWAGAGPGGSLLVCGPTLPTCDHITPPLPRYMRSPIVPKGHLLLRSWTLGACGHDWSSQQGGARTPESPSGAGRGCALCPQDTAPGAAGHMHWGPPPLCSQVTKQGVGSDCRRGFAGTRPPQNRRAPPTRPQGLT